MHKKIMLVRHLSRIIIWYLFKVRVWVKESLIIKVHDLLFDSWLPGWVVEESWNSALWSKWTGQGTGWKDRGSRRRKWKMSTSQCIFCVSMRVILNESVYVVCGLANRVIDVYSVWRSTLKAISCQPMTSSSQTIT